PSRDTEKTADPSSPERSKTVHISDFGIPRLLSITSDYALFSAGLLPSPQPASQISRYFKF
ncbi:UNVERIFIED_CONTAM: hypothetical protein NY603_25260, partial [Bacteroidetes bacterium 56_B9]